MYGLLFHTSTSMYIHKHIMRSSACIYIGGLGFTTLSSAHCIIHFTLASPPHHVSDGLRCFVAHNAVVRLPNQKEMVEWRERRERRERFSKPLSKWRFCFPEPVSHVNYRPLLFTPAKLPHPGIITYIPQENEHQNHHPNLPGRNWPLISHPSKYTPQI